MVTVSFKGEQRITLSRQHPIQEEPIVAEKDETWRCGWLRSAALPRGVTSFLALAREVKTLTRSRQSIAVFEGDLDRSTVPSQNLAPRPSLPAYAITTNQWRPLRPPPPRNSRSRHAPFTAMTRTPAMSTRRRSWRPSRQPRRSSIAKATTTGPSAHRLQQAASHEPTSIRVTRHQSGTGWNQSWAPWKRRTP